MDPDQLHRHYQLQAAWLAEGRAHLFRRAGLAARQRILDFGCGSGVLTAEATRLAGRPVLGVDRERALIEYAARTYPGLPFLAADENELLRRGGRYDLIFLSFVLLWQRRPAALLRALRRLLADDGVLLLLAEPDYGGRIDFPPVMAEMAQAFRDHIRASGGDPDIGRKLPGLLARCGYRAEAGVFGQTPAPFPAGRQWLEEWAFWRELCSLAPATVKRLQRAERRAARRSQRVMFMPVFYALARPAAIRKKT